MQEAWLGAGLVRDWDVPGQSNGIPWLAAQRCLHAAVAQIFNLLYRDYNRQGAPCLRAGLAQARQNAIL